MLDQLTLHTFEARKGETFLLSDERLGDLPLTLTEVLTNGMQGNADRQQFSLHFQGPGEPRLPQRIYRLDNEATGALELFLVPVGRDEGGFVYEAVFT